MKISVQDVEHIADLARLELTEAEKEQYSIQLSAILDYFDKLRNLDTDSVLPLSHPLHLENTFQSDQAIESVAPQAALSNAPDQAEDCFRVPLILEQ
jgi:aspartyl-tRNA(Asn)/glutamyl-tRNA(Gln) amidotransferase subunit C